MPIRRTVTYYICIPGVDMDYYTRRASSEYLLDRIRRKEFIRDKIPMLIYNLAPFINSFSCV